MGFFRSDNVAFLRCRKTTACRQIGLVFAYHIITVAVVAASRNGEKLTGNGSEQQAKWFVFTSQHTIYNVHIFFETSCDNIIMFNDIEKRVSSITQKMRSAVGFCFLFVVRKDVSFYLERKF